MLDPWTLHVGDCVPVMAAMSAESVDAIVCDPPYGIAFMARKWDSPAHMNAPVEALHSSAPLAAFQAWSTTWAREALRVMKPGAHLVAFGGPRAFHRLTCALEDVGFEIRDVLSWLYGSGFPKSLDVSKAIDKAAGIDFPVAGHRVTHEAATWNGWGTALKPAWEPIILARKPVETTTVASVLRHGTGAVNVDACRIPWASGSEAAEVDARVAPNARYDPASAHGDGSIFGLDGQAEIHTAGRWPANVCLDAAAAGMLDEQIGTLRSGTVTKTYTPRLEESVALGKKRRNLSPDKVFSDSGGPSRFFYTSKASRAERDDGCEDLEERAPGDVTGGRAEGSAGLQSPRAGAGRTSGGRNMHPTVKPVDLMQWLVRLVTPPGGIVLDPFAGSGTTGIAALREGFRFVGVERELDFAEVARARLKHAAGRLDLFAWSDLRERGTHVNA